MKKSILRVEKSFGNKVKANMGVVTGCRLGLVGKTRILFQV